MDSPARRLSEFLEGLPSVDQLFLADQVDRDLVLAFLMTFSRAEHALKSCGFATEANSQIRIDWNDFADAVADRVFTSGGTAVADATAFLTRCPPKRQTLGPERWVARTGSPRNARFLIKSVTTVRNNLFHGGKEMTWRLAERDRRLIESALLVLKHVVQLHVGVRAAFGEVGPSHSPNALQRTRSSDSRPRSSRP